MKLLGVWTSTSATLGQRGATTTTGWGSIPLSRGRTRATTTRRSTTTVESELWPSWTKSVGDDEAELLYMPFLEHQLSVVEALGGEKVEVPERLAYAYNEAKKSRMGSRVFRMEGMFRRVRMTYFDGGTSLQVFNSLWYPSYEKLDAPLLGIDLLCFGTGKAQRLLCVVDAQPAAGRSPDGGVSHDTDGLTAVHSGYPELGGVPTARWYEDNRYFSNQMLYGTADTLGGPLGVTSVLFPAFVAYLDAYVDVVAKCPNASDDDGWTAQANHAAYDLFNAQRDPAHKLFRSYFGEDFADAYVRDFLFALSRHA